VDLDVRGVLEYVSKGRDYSPLWEALALAGDARLGGPLVLDDNPGRPGLQARNHPGVSNIEDHGRAGGTLAVTATFYDRIHFDVSAGATVTQAHLITAARAGVDLRGYSLANDIPGEKFCSSAAPY
jgi:hypothetical protein